MAEIIIRDQLGRAIYQSEKYAGQNTLTEYFDLTDYPKGIYFVELKLNSESKTLPVVIQ
jgi:hypothetical protein